MQKLGVFWKIQDICYQMGTEIFKIEDEMTEKMKLKVVDPIVFENLTAHLEANILNFPDHPQLLHFG